MGGVWFEKMYNWVDGIIIGIIKGGEILIFQSYWNRWMHLVKKLIDKSGNWLYSEEVVE